MAGMPGNQVLRNAGGDNAAAALVALREGLRALARLGNADDSEDLAMIAAALDRIELRRTSLAAEPGLRDDPARLDRLLALAGPADAVELLTRFETDLAETARRIATALAANDAAALRAASHVLIAVAGSLGALGVEAQARHLNAEAHRAGPGPDAAPGLAAAAEAALAGIATLTRRLAARRTEGP